ncbi:MAG: response regulator, partial [Polyangiaceae bacterium]
LDRKLARSICSEITRQHGGTLTSESVAGKGTTVTLSLPRPAVAKPDIPRATTPTRASSRPLPRVLLIDDEPLVLSAFSRLLRKDCELSSANGGADAVRILKEDTDWDLVICDMMMPGLDGPAVFSFVETNIPELSSRFAVCTGGAFTERVTAFLESFEGIVLEKPLRKRDVLDVLARTKPDERG